MNHIIKFNDNEIRNEFIKSFSDDFSSREIARILNISKSTVNYNKNKNS